MADFAEYEQYDGLGLAELARRGKVHPEELCEAAIRRIKRRNPALNAIITTMFEEGRTQVAAPLPDGPFCGVPFLLKDILHTYAGVPMTFGSAALRDYVPDHDSELVRRFKAAGLVMLGKTNVPEFGPMGVTEPEAYGPARNPWNLGRTPGGSSGGAAAAVAACLVPLASASDGGGSIRIPASCCGLFGLRPTRGRVPTGPDYGEVWEGASSDHAITRSVRDSAAMLDWIEGADPGAPYQIPPPARPYREAMKEPPRPLRVGYNVQSPIDEPVHPACVWAVEETGRLLEDLGHTVEEAAPDVDGEAVARVYITMYFGQVAATLDWVALVRGNEAARHEVEETTRALGLVGRTLSAGAYVKAKYRWNTFARAMAAFHERYDLYLTPTMATPPVRIGSLAPSWPEELLIKIINRLRMGQLLVAGGVIDRLAREPEQDTLHAARQPHRTACHVGSAALDTGGAAVRRPVCRALRR